MPPNLNPHDQHLSVLEQCGRMSIAASVETGDRAPDLRRGIEQLAEARVLPGWEPPRQDLTILEECGRGGRGDVRPATGLHVFVAGSNSSAEARALKLEPMPPQRTCPFGSEGRMMAAGGGEPLTVIQVVNGSNSSAEAGEGLTTIVGVAYHENLLILSSVRMTVAG